MEILHRAKGSEILIADKCAILKFKRDRMEYLVEYCCFLLKSALLMVCVWRFPEGCSAGKEPLPPAPWT